MIRVRTPLRISLFGGGTDYPEFYRRHQGSVIGFTIDKYIYLNALVLGAFVEYRYRLSYSRIETVDHVASIQHPVVRALLAHTGYDQPTDFSIQADLPASSGLGSSSAFTVGFIHLLSHLQGIPRTKMELARLAIFTEQTLLKERVGIQDQLHSTFGGLNRFDFTADDFSLRPMAATGTQLDMLSSWMLLVFTNIKRHASEVVKEQSRKTSTGELDQQLIAMRGFCDQAQRLLENLSGEAAVRELAEMLEASWIIKRQLSTAISNSEIDGLYARCKEAGALGGKLCGAGGGGFLLLIVPPAQRERLKQLIRPYQTIDFRMDHLGSVALS